MDVQIYENKKPIINENVLVIFTEYKETHIEAELLEYCNEELPLNGIMIYEDATRKKKVYDWKKIVPLKKPMVAKIEEVFPDNYVKLSIIYFNQNLDPIELNKTLMKPFLDNKIIITMIKKICRNCNLNFNEFWPNVMYKIIKEKRIDNLNDSLLDYILDNKSLFEDIIKENYPENSDNIISECEKQILNKIYKIQSKFSLIAKKSIEDTKELLRLTCENNNWNYSLKYETTPYFILESSSENSTQENHDNFLQYLEDNSKLFNINYLKIN